ncbi:alpha/beta hydrolase family protein [Geodermatophilus marinus]|uniref:alpha/beta hydrolase family protein n=1 Tax=Geodermatophilus sp. LHW52908 TaxID=2303986 RepID=UPI0013147032|nr:chlorophyllase [Geodermatophilus sp. LHW52908]
MTSTQVSLEDGSRGGYDADGNQVVATRELETTIWYPTEGDGPFPLVVFSHGYLATPEKYEELLSRWSSAGMVVAAPRFPLSAEGAAEIRADVPQQPGDVAFVLDQVLRLAETPGSDIEGLVDPERIAAAGHSLGALTTAFLRSEYGFVSGFDAALVLAGGPLDYLVPELAEKPPLTFVDAGTPILFVHGDQDDAIPVEQGEQLYGAAPAPKAFLEVPGADHSSTYEEDSYPTWPVVAEVTTDYLQWALDIDPAALEDLRSAVDGSGAAFLADDELG